MTTEADAKNLSELEREAENTRADLVETVDKYTAAYLPRLSKKK